MPQVDDLATNLTPLLVEFLPRQRWYPHDDQPERVVITSLDVHRKEPLLLWALVDVTAPRGETATYQIVVAGRPVTAQPTFLQGKERVTVGVLDDVLLYDALIDPELALDVLAVVAPDETVEVARPLVVEQTNSSVVYDERLILKLFRRLHPEPNPDVEVTGVLNDRGFPHVVAQRAVLRRDPFDLAVVRDYQRGATDAWQLAHTSLRDLLASRLPPDEAGADFAPEAAMLGEVTAKLHATLADAFGTSPAAPDTWLADMLTQLDRTAAVAAAIEAVDVPRLAAAFRELMAVDDPGSAIRFHGDLHLGQFLIAGSDWYVLDFEGEPIRTVAERARPASPLRDVGGMLLSFHYASRAALLERGRDVDPELDELADAWRARAVEAFWHGYHRSGFADASLLPASDADQWSMLTAFELDKAVYQVAYELGHRPDWIDIPTSAVERILGRRS